MVGRKEKGWQEGENEKNHSHFITITFTNAKNEEIKCGSNGDESREYKLPWKTDEADNLKGHTHDISQTIIDQYIDIWQKEMNQTFEASEKSDLLKNIDDVFNNKVSKNEFISRIKKGFR